MDDENGESMEPREQREEVPLIGLRERWLETERSRELIQETRGSILERTICYSFIRKEDDVDGRASMTKDEERVLRGG